MATEYTIPAIIAYSQIGQYYTSNQVSSFLARYGSVIDEKYPKRLYCVRSAVQFANNALPNTATLRQVAEYLFALVPPQAIAIFNNLSAAPPIITGPVSVSIAPGQNAVFTISVASTLPYTVQWYDYQNNAIPGATGLTYTFLNAQLTDSGKSFQAKAISQAGTAVSTVVSVTVTASLFGYFSVGTTDYFAALNGGVDAVPYNGTFVINHLSPLTVPIGSVGFTNLYNVVKYPIGEGIKTTWVNTILNSGQIPDQIYRATVTVGSFLYLITRVPMTVDSTQANIIFS